MTKRLFAMLMVLLLIVAAVPAVAAPVSGVPVEGVLIGAYRFWYVADQSGYDAESGTTTFTYVAERETGMTGSQYPAISHLVMGLCSADLVPAGGTINGSPAILERHISQPDPTTGWYGLKWDSVPEFNPLTFTVTFPGNVPVTTGVFMGYKAGNPGDEDSTKLTKAEGQIMGPGCDTIDSLDSSVSAAKFFDVNVDGIYDATVDFLIAGWKIELVGYGVQFTEEPLNTVVWDELPYGEYTLIEHMPLAAEGAMYRWQATTLMEQTATTSVDEENAPTVYFGNICTGTSTNGTQGFWSNKNGQKLIGTDDLGYLNGLGVWGSFSNSGAVLNYLTKNANAKDMAVMLKAQLLAAALNVWNYDLHDTRIIVDLDNHLSYTGDELIAMGVNALSLDRAEMETVKTILDNFNNNRYEVLADMAMCMPIVYGE